MIQEIQGLSMTMVVASTGMFSAAGLAAPLNTCASDRSPLVCFSAPAAGPGREEDLRAPGSAMHSAVGFTTYCSERPARGGRSIIASHHRAVADAPAPVASLPSL